MTHRASHVLMIMIIIIDHFYIAT